jgi:hypothetical protein
MIIIIIFILFFLKIMIPFGYQLGGPLSAIVKKLVVIYYYLMIDVCLGSFYRLPCDLRCGRPTSGGTFRKRVWARQTPPFNLRTGDRGLDSFVLFVCLVPHKVWTWDHPLNTSNLKPSPFTHQGILQGKVPPNSLWALISLYFSLHF